ncbi:helix-turn-helix domain-containing protein [bacterium]|nr:helix-turn-helix domain-containing protein [bacterium]
MDGNDVKKIRLSLNLTQEEFAHHLGVTLCTVSRWENNKTSPSRLALKQIQRLAIGDKK